MSQQLGFDFELMMKLATEAPAEFARQREALIQDAIASFRHPEHGRRLQAEIEAFEVSSLSRNDRLDSEVGNPASARILSLSKLIRRIRMSEAVNAWAIPGVSAQDPK